jgi:hypothetical protein
MKKLILSGFLAAGMLYTSQAQILVSTAVQKKNVLLEKFTGINCGACPSGDDEIATLKSIHKDRLDVYAVHTFTLNPGDIDYGTPYGEPLAQTSKATGYPAGNVNRLMIEDLNQNDDGTAMGKSKWAQVVEAELEKDAIVNVASKMFIDKDAKEVYLYIEMFYLQDAPQEQYINAHLVQDGIIGPQAGQGDTYQHDHMHRKNLTNEQWGESIGTPEEGDLVTRTYSWVYPDSVGPVEFIAEAIEGVVFVSNHKDSVQNSMTVHPIILHPEAINAKIEHLSVDLCGEEIVPKLVLSNMGVLDISSVDIKYSVNGNEHEYNWNGTLSKFGFDVVSLPGIPNDAALQGENLLIEIIEVNADGLDDQPADDFFNFEIKEFQTVHAHSEVEIKLDGFGEDFSWELKNPNGAIIAEGNGYSNGVDDVITESFSLPSSGCFELTIKDENNNGLKGGQDPTNGSVFNPGYFKVFNNGNLLYELNGEFTNTSRIMTPDEVTIGQDELSLNNEISLIPNPSNGNFTVTLESDKNEEATFLIMDYLGREISRKTMNVVSGKNMISFNENLKSGMYLLQIQTTDKSDKVKFVIE